MAYVYPVVVGAGVVAGIAGIIVLVRRAHGKSLALLGPRMSGKTTLATFLETGEIPRGYRPTVIRSTREGRQRVPRAGQKMRLGIRMKDVALKLTILDNPGMTPHGERTHYRTWLDSASNADAICYLVDVTLLPGEKYSKVALNGAQHIARWEQCSGRKLLILTHTDLDPAWESGDPDEISGRATVKALRRELRTEEEIIMGSLKDEDGARELTYQLLQILAR